MEFHLNNKWSTCNNSNNYFKIRSSNYLINKSKYTPSNSILEFYDTECFLIKDPNNIKSICNIEKTIFHKKMKNDPNIKFTLITCFILSKYLIIFYWVSYNEIHSNNTSFDNVFNNFIKLQEGKKDRLKFIPSIIKPNNLLTKWVSGNPILIGKKLTLDVNLGNQYMEIMINLTSNFIAKHAINKLMPYSKKIIMNFCWIIESTTDEELPEHLLATAKIENISFDNVTEYLYN